MRIRGLVKFVREHKRYQVMSGCIYDAKIIFAAVFDEFE